MKTIGKQLYQIFFISMFSSRFSAIFIAITTLSFISCSHVNKSQQKSKRLPAYSNSYLYTHNSEYDRHQGVAAIVYLGKIKDRRDNGSCTGVFIGKRSFITAAHCVSNPINTIFPYRFFHHKFKRQVPVQIQKINTHPNYVPDEHEFDIAVIHFKNPTPKEVGALKRSDITNEAPVKSSLVLVGGYGDNLLNPDGSFRLEPVFEKGELSHLNFTPRLSGGVKNIKKVEDSFLILSKRDYYTNLENKLAHGDSGSPVYSYKTESVAKPIKSFNRKLLGIHLKSDKKFLRLFTKIKRKNSHILRLDVPIINDWLNSNIK